MAKHLTFEEAINLINNSVLGTYNNFINIDVQKFKRIEWLIDDYQIDESNKVIRFDLVDANDSNPNPFKVPHYLISKIGHMSISDMLKAYDLTLNNRAEEIDIETDVVKDVIGKNSATIDGFKLQEGQRFIFLKDATPKYRNRILTVKFGKEGIRLVANRGRPKKIV
jgi:hypothetical protein